MAARSKKPRNRQFKERLDQLGCPYTEDLEEAVIQEIICRPGEHHIRLLHWLFAKMDSSLNELLDPGYLAGESKMDSRIQRLLFVASALGLCRYDDVDLIRGATSASQQLGLFDHLLDLVSIMDAADDPRTKALQCPGIISKSSTLTEQYTADCDYVDRLCSEVNLDELFNTKVSLLPPDLQKSMEIKWVEKGFGRDRPPPVDLQALVDRANELSRSLESQTQTLQEIKADYQYQGPEESAGLKIASKTLQVVLSELAQLVVSFTYCFETEMLQWCHREAPVLTDLGAVFKRVYNQLQLFVRVLKNFQEIRQSFSNLDVDIKAKLNVGSRTGSKARDLASASQAALESFQQCASILEESMHRHDNVSFSSTLRSDTLRL